MGMGVQGMRGPLRLAHHMLERTPQQSRTATMVLAPPPCSRH
jgi:hypothetical protein